MQGLGTDCHVSKSKHQRSTAVDQIPCTLDRCAISALITVLSTVFRKRNGGSSAHSLRVLFPGIAEGPHPTPTNVRLHERPAECFMLAGLP